MQHAFRRNVFLFRFLQGAHSDLIRSNKFVGRRRFRRLNVKIRFLHFTRRRQGYNGRKFVRHMMTSVAINNMRHNTIRNIRVEASFTERFFRRAMIIVTRDDLHRNTAVDNLLCRHTIVDGTMITQRFRVRLFRMVIGAYVETAHH